jgi:subtilisin family serine protease
VLFRLKLLVCLTVMGCVTARAADRFIDLGAGSVYAGNMAYSGFSLAAPQWMETSVFNRVNSFIPNDPLYSSQWHLGAAHVQEAWDRGYSGAGVTIGLVDDGVQMNHPDLSVSAFDSYDFVQNDNDPSPTLPDQNHGTAVAGVAAAKGNNSLGVIAPAYNATVAGLKVGFDGSGTYQQFVNATLYHSSSVNPAQNTIKIKNHSYGVASPYADDAELLAESAALNQSAAAGTIHVLAAGNDGGDANWKRFQSTDSAIVVSATADDGTSAYYSNIGANITVTAPSSGGAQSITTTDRTGSDGYTNADYTAQFGGTSASAPLVAGIIAMGVEANPTMDVRTAKHLLAMTSEKIDATSLYWNQNAAGVDFNPFYGFGMIDAGAFVAAAGIYTGVTDRVVGTANLTPVGGKVIADRPDDGSWLWGHVTNINVAAGIFSDPLEEIVLTVSMQASAASAWSPTELTIDVLDPYGNQLTAAFYSTTAAGTNEIVSWNYVVNGFWGEGPAGQWLIGLGDGVDNGQTGTLTELSMTFNTGQVVPEPSPVTLVTLVCAVAFWIRRRFPAY